MINYLQTLYELGSRVNPIEAVSYLGRYLNQSTSGNNDPAGTILLTILVIGSIMSAIGFATSCTSYSRR
jgi:hypothetical protein